jgi:pimeloyl-ACP methyl ester carboxylesterase
VRLVLVHGSVANGAATWAAQQPLAERFELVVWNRPGYPPGPPLARIDFEDQAAELAALLRPDDHLCGHSYGGVISLLAAAARAHELGSLTVVEPPAFSIAADDPAVLEFVTRFEAIRAAGPHDPEEYLRRFLPLVGAPFDVPDRLPPALEQGTRAAMVERPPQEATIPLDELAAAPFRKLVVSGGHDPALDAVCDVLVQRLVAERAVVTGAGHSIPRLGGPFNSVLADFVEQRVLG